MQWSVWERKVRGMKKILLASAAGMGLLASCGDVTVSIPDYFNGSRSTSLTVDSVSNIRTNWQLSANVTDQNGKVIPAGSYVICDNTTTNIDADIAWTGTLSKLGLQLRGVVNPTEYRNANVYPYGGVTGSSSTTATFTVGAGMAPKSITVNPVPVANVKVKGYTYLRVQGQDALGGVSNIKESPNELPVVDCGA